MADEVPRQSEMPLKLPPPFEKPYLDSSVFLAHVKKEANLTKDGHTRLKITTSILEGAKQGLYVIYTSFLTIAEVRRLKESRKELTQDELLEVNALFAEFLEHEWIMPIEVDRQIAEKAQELGAIHSMSPTDAIHLASAIINKCNVLMAWDKPTFTDKFIDYEDYEEDGDVYIPTLDEVWQALMECQAQGVVGGIYSARWMWDKYHPNYTAFAEWGVPIWASQPDGIADPDVFTPFGGWTRCEGKQYMVWDKADSGLGYDLDLDVFRREVTE